MFQSSLPKFFRRGLSVEWRLDEIQGDMVGLQRRHPIHGDYEFEVLKGQFMFF
jgi:hypothetical protein